MNKPYLTDTLDAFAPLNPALMIKHDAEAMTANLYVEHDGEKAILGTMTASKFANNEYEVLGVAAYPSIGRAMYCFSMMALKERGCWLYS